MAASDSKTITVKLAFDEGSWRKFKDVVSQITVEVSKLVEELNRAGSKLNMGGGGFVSVGNKPSPAAQSGGVMANVGQTVSAKIGGVGSNITQALVENRNLLKAVSTGSKEAMREMAQEVSASIRTQVAEIEK